ncbi:UPF0687 protein C20orf27 homolog isoform X1 [Oncorhynchus tshawytscha]|uniref:Uncharacterized protein n=2 Tax=Oncorhynchus tshawytscha TaxID=74940 RepID=A0AAZ3RZM5_ONCTS|nr:UPF0687 protein C20orf27 homolog isoform X1 [Oncorhynchus tshawytscha]
MATGRKGSTSKGGSVRFPDDEDAMGSPVHREDKAKDSSIPALPEPDGNFLVKVGFLRSLHRYEIVFTLPEVPVLGKDVCSLPSSSSPTPRPLLKVNRVTPTSEGGVKVTCEYTTHQEGVLQEELTLVSRGKKDQRLRVRLQARVMDRHHGTPLLLEGVRCLGAEKEKRK